MHVETRPPVLLRACAQNQVSDISVMRNSLSGPVFPPAWLGPGSALDLRRYEVSDNAGLVGPLPDALNWSRLELL